MAAAISGQTTVTTAGTAVQGPSTTPGELFAIKALSTNTGVVYIGNNGSGDVTSSNGFELEPGDMIIIDVTENGNMSGLWLDSAVNGEGVSWIRLS